jgi:hypothetical protein
MPYRRNPATDSTWFIKNTSENNIKYQIWEAFEKTSEMSA